MTTLACAAIHVSVLRMASRVASSRSGSKRTPCSSSRGGTASTTRRALNSTMSSPSTNARVIWSPLSPTDIRIWPRCVRPGGKSAASLSTSCAIPPGRRRAPSWILFPSMRSGILSGSFRCSMEPSSCWGISESSSSATKLLIKGCVSGQNQVGPRSIARLDPALTTDRMRPPRCSRASNKPTDLPCRCRLLASTTPHNPPPMIAVPNIDQPTRLATHPWLCKIRARSDPARQNPRFARLSKQLAQNLIIPYAAPLRMEIDMNVTLDFVNCPQEELKALLDGGTLTIYSVARPLTADKPVERSGTLATFTFASPAFGAASDGLENPVFTANPVAASSVGTPGFARARKADGTVIADFSAGPGDREIKFSEVSFSQGAPVKVTAFKFIAEGGWPERPEYYDTRPRTGFPMPTT